MKAKEALEKYGFKLVDGMYIRVLNSRPDLSTERWVPVEGGWRCYKQVSDWGHLDPATGLYAVPWRQTGGALINGVLVVTGLHPAEHPGAFEFVWPEEVVAFQYQYAGQEGWVRQADGSMLRA